MSNYTTGELAKAAEVTVRTVQYYDSRGILIPTDFSEGGRRLYTDEDLKKLKVICYLKDLGLGLNDIGKILEADNASGIVKLLLEEQKKVLEAEVAEKKEQMERIDSIQKQLQHMTEVSVENISDVAYIMENKKKMRKVYTVLFGVGLVLDGLEIGAVIYGIRTGEWLLFAGVIALMLVALGPIVNYYYKYAVYICPECHTVFKPKKGEFFWAKHTPKTRNLTCTACGHKGYCVETFDDAMESSKEQ